MEGRRCVGFFFLKPRYFVPPISNKKNYIFICKKILEKNIFKEILNDFQLRGRPVSAPAGGLKKNEYSMKTSSCSVEMTECVPINTLYLSRVLLCGPRFSKDVTVHDFLSAKKRSSCLHRVSWVAPLRPPLA